MQLLLNCKGQPHWKRRNFKRFKTFNAMKISRVLLMAACLVFLIEGHSQKISLSLKNAPLEKAFKLIEQQTSYRFVYSDEAMTLSKPVSVKVREVTLEGALSACFANQPLEFSIEDKLVIVKVVEKKVDNTPPLIDVHGKITNENGEPLGGATIASIKGGKSTAADDKGYFLLSGLQANDVLEISSVGYLKQTVSIKNHQEFLVKLKTSVGILDETVVMAYGKTSRRFNTGNISKISSRELEKQPVSNPLVALQGLVPGLNITQSSGLNGAAVKVQIRGQNSILQGSQPLYIVDGIPYAPGNDRLNQITNATDEVGMSPFNLIDLNTIESIEILKDADATAIYGSRGANGVIIITTKKGLAGKTKLSLNVYTGISKVSRTMNMLNTQEYVEMRREGFKNDGYIPSADPSDPGYAPDIMLWDTTRYTDLKKLLIGGTANNTNAQMSLSGGSVNTQFLLGAGFERNTSVFPTDLGDTKLSTYFNLNHESDSKKLGVHFYVSFLSDENKLNVTDLTSSINLPPNIKLYTDDGQINWQENGVLFSDVLFRQNPLAALKTVYKGNFKNMISNLQINYKLFENLFAKINLGYNILQGNETSAEPGTSIDPYSGNLPSANFSNNTQTSWIAEPQVEYIKDSKYGKITILAGGTWQQNQNEGIAVQALDYTNDALLGSVDGAGTVFTTNSFNQYRYTAVFGRINYQYKSRYIFNASGRRDGSTRFGPNKRFSNFGAIGGAWVFSNEKFFHERTPFISFGKIRGSYGITGNDQIGDYKYLDTWTSSPNTYQGVPVTTPTALFNPDFSWELNRKAELALDLGFLKDRIIFSVSYYKNICNNQLINYTLPVQTGFTSVLKNMDASLQNKGFEIELSTKNIHSDNFTWNSSINLTTNQNKLLSFPGLATSSYANTYFIGKSVTTRKLYNYLGVDPATGIYSFEDVDKNETLDKTDRIQYVNTDPKIFGGFLNVFQLKNFSASLLFEFKKQKGYNYLVSNKSVFPPGYGLVNQPAAVLERWQEPGDQSEVQKFTAKSSSEAFYNMKVYLPLSNAGISDASFIRCKNVSLSYALPLKRIQKLQIDKFSIYINAQNLFVITGYKGSDPETQNLFVLPPMKTIVGGFQITF
jgi:TonB-linked SusC/RagA family outer membrane protein